MCRVLSGCSFCLFVELDGEEVFYCVRYDEKFLLMRSDRRVRFDDTETDEIFKGNFGFEERLGGPFNISSDILFALMLCLLQIVFSVFSVSAVLHGVHEVRVESPAEELAAGSLPLRQQLRAAYAGLQVHRLSLFVPARVRRVRCSL